MFEVEGVLEVVFLDLARLLVAGGLVLEGVLMMLLLTRCGRAVLMVFCCLMKILPGPRRRRP